MYCFSFATVLLHFSAFYPPVYRCIFCISYLLIWCSILINTCTLATANLWWRKCTVTVTVCYKQSVVEFCSLSEIVSLSLFLLSSKCSNTSIGWIVSFASSVRSRYFFVAEDTVEKYESLHYVNDALASPRFLYFSKLNATSRLSFLGKYLACVVTDRSSSSSSRLRALYLCISRVKQLRSLDLVIQLASRQRFTSDSASRCHPISSQAAARLQAGHSLHFITAVRRNKKRAIISHCTVCCCCCFILQGTIRSKILAD